MVQPSEKLKKIILIMGITGAVYLCFQYLLPLVIPFLLAYGIAVLLQPSAVWFARKLRVRIGSKYYGIPVGAVGVMELMLAVFAIGIWVYIGGQKLYVEAGMLIERIPHWIDSLDYWLTGICHNMETVFRLQEGCLVILVRDMIRGLLSSIKNAAMPYLMGNSVTVFRWFIQITVIWVIMVIAVMFSLQEMDIWKKRGKHSLFHQELELIGRRLSIVCNAYLKTQGIIMLLTTTICIIVLGLLGNPYYILAGVGIGLLDALPIFGTGTVLIPWALISFLGRRWGEGVVILGLYIICYILREVLETKLMGNKVGLSPLETLISMYVGLQLFGLPGFLLGPIGLLLIEDGVAAASEKADENAI